MICNDIQAVEAIKFLRNPGNTSRATINQMKRDLRFYQQDTGSGWITFSGKCGLVPISEFRTETEMIEWFANTGFAKFLKATHIRAVDFRGGRYIYYRSARWK